MTKNPAHRNAIENMSGVFPVMMHMINLRHVRIRSAFLLVFTVMVLAIPTMVSDVKATASTTVAAASISLYPGGTGDVPITVRDIPSDGGGLGSYDLAVTFNPSVVKVLEVAGGSEPFDGKPTSNIDNIGGLVKFNSYTGVIPGPKGSITIARLRVQAVGNAGSSSSLDFTKIGLVDANTTAGIPATGVSGSVTIMTPKSSSSISLFTDKKQVRIDEPVTLSGAISPAHAATVTLTFTRPDMSSFTRTASSGTDGSYVCVLTCDMGGSWTAVTSWPGDADHYGATSSPATFTVNKLNSSISVAVTTSRMEPIESVQIEGSITPPHAGFTVQIKCRPSKGEWTEIAKVKTNMTGGYSYVLNISLMAPETYEVKVSWSGDWDHEGAESTSAYFHIAGNSALSIFLSSNSTAVNGTVIIRGHVSPLHTYVNATISTIAPNGSLSMHTLQTDVAGNYKMKFTPDTVGTWGFNSSWLGDAETLGSESPTVYLVVAETGSSINLEVNTPSIAIGSPITFLGEIRPPLGESTVTLTLTRPNSSWVVLQTISSADGHFSLTYTPDQAGIWIVDASWYGNLNCSGATSVQRSFAVDKLTSGISLSLSPPIPKKGDLVTLEGTLTPSTSRASVKLLISIDDGKTWEIAASPTTEAEGEYVAYWRPDRIGTFMLKTEWVGDEEHSGCVSHILTLAVQEEILCQTVPLPNDSKTEVLLSSNSKTITFKVDAANGEIEANVTGPSETIGVINIFIPIKLLDSYNKTIGELAFAFDGNLVTPDILEVAGGHLVTIYYSHNASRVSVHFLTYSLTVALADYNGGALAGANVSLTGPVSVSNITNGTGVTLFTNLPKGNYKIEVYYGAKAGDSTVNLTENETLTIATTVGQYEAEYTNLQAEHQTLITELANQRTAVYLFLTTAIVFLAARFFLGRKKNH